MAMIFPPLPPFDIVGDVYYVVCALLRSPLDCCLPTFQSVVVICFDVIGYDVKNMFMIRVGTRYRCHMTYYGMISLPSNAVVMVLFCLTVRFKT